MLVNSCSRNSTNSWTPSYLKRTAYSSALESRFKKIDKKLIDFSENSAHFNRMGNVYSQFVFASFKPTSNKWACGTTARAIVMENLFHQSRYQKIDKVKKLFRAFLDNEEGTFSLNFYGNEFINQENETAVFQGHSFVIIKVIEEDQTGYLLAQSYVEQYSLKTFILNKDRYFFDFSTLKEKILRPYLALLYKEGAWTERECQAFSAITSIYSERLKGFYPDKKVWPSGRLLDKASFGRTTDNAPGYEMRINNISFLMAQMDRDKGDPNWAFDKVVLVQPPVSQVLKQRFEAIDDKLKQLISTEGLMVQLAKTYYKTIHNRDMEVVEEDSKCQDAVGAIVQANLFNHSYLQRLTLQELEAALTDSEEGTFALNLYSDTFINSDNQTQLFPGHSFIIIKVIEGSEIGYRFVPSFVEQLALADFLESKINCYDNYNTLLEHLIKPFCALIERNGPWRKEELSDLFLLTSFYSAYLEGYFPPSGSLNFDILRTTNEPTGSYLPKPLVNFVPSTISEAQRE